MRDLLKETGKYLYDISKIILALAIITPLVIGEDISIYPILVSFGLFIAGALMIYKGSLK